MSSGSYFLFCAVAISELNFIALKLYAVLRITIDWGLRFHDNGWIHKLWTKPLNITLKPLNINMKYHKIKKKWTARSKLLPLRKGITFKVFVSLNAKHSHRNPTKGKSVQQFKSILHSEYDDVKWIMKWEFNFYVYIIFITLYKSLS